MKTTKTVKTLAIAATAAFCLSPLAARAGAARALGVMDPSAETAYIVDGVVVLATQTFHGDLVKQGGGDSSLSLADVHTSKGRIVAADGTLSVAGATAATAPGRPDSVLSRAAVWLDASLPGTISFAEGSVVNVAEWRDVRETGSGTGGDPYLYTRAVASTNVAHSSEFAPDPAGWFPVYSPASGGENAYVDFGQYYSGRHVDFKAPSGNAATVSYLRHAFVVLGTHDGHYGFIFNPGGNPVFVPANYRDLTNCVLPSAFIQSTTGWTVLLNGLFRVDGVAVDPVNEVGPNGGWQLLDIMPGRDGWTVDGLFSHNDIANSSDGYRQGGGRLCEIILFTSPLEECDRVKVEAYLCHKWFGAHVSSPAFAVGEEGKLSLSSGRIDMAQPVPLSVGGGSALNSETGIVERTAAAASSVVKTGSGELVVGEVASDVALIDVREGTLRLRQGVSAPVAIPTNFTGRIEDPSFEAFSDRTVGEWGYTLSAATHGWLPYGEYETPQIAKWKSGGGPFNVDGMAYPDGQYVGVLHIRAGLQTTVTLPADGIYRLTYSLAQRPTYKGHEHRILIDGVPVAQVKAWDSSSNWHRVSFRLPFLAAGDHTLALAGDLNNSKDSRTANLSVDGSIMTGVTGNIVALVDDFHVDWEELGAGYVAVSNASFEVSSFSARGYEPNPADLGGWEYVSTNISNRVVLEQTWNGRNTLRPASDGCRILNLYNQVQIGQTLTFPKVGRYTLTCAAATAVGDSVASNRGSLRFTLGGTEIGTVAPDEVMTTYGFAFDVPSDSYTAQLVVAGQVSGAVVSLDDIRICGGGDAVVVRNSFDSAGWSRHHPSSEISSGSGQADWLTGISGDVAESWGRMASDCDWNRVGIRNNASIWRTVAFPSAGTYRLSVAAIGRFYRAYGTYLTDPAILTRYNGNAFNVWVAKGGVTNVVGTFGVDDRERFVTHRFIFELPEGGDWEVGFTGLKQSEQKIPGSAAWHSCGGVLDDLVIERVTPKALLSTPEAIEIDVAAGATLALDYVGTNSAENVRYAGRKLSGIVNAQTHPEFVTGIGSLNVRRKGVIVLVL